MAYQDRYAEYVQQIPAYIESCREENRRVVFGYASDLDVVIDWDPEKFSRFLESYLKEEPSVKEIDSIDSLEDFARIVSYYAVNGLGGEVDITSLAVCDYVQREFDTDYALGGTGAQGAAAFGAVGFPLIVYLTDRCRPVCRFLDYPGVESIEEGRQVPVMDIATDDVPVMHIIFQFTKGDVIRWGSRSWEIPRSNRLIIDYDTIHKDLPVSPDFYRFCEENAGKIISYNVSGFNAIVDEAVARRRMEQLTAHYARVKAANPQCVIFFEGAHYLNPAVKEIVFEEIVHQADILGMNEEELVDMGGRLGCAVDEDDLDSVLAGLGKVMETYPARGIILHTKDYSMYFGHPMPQYNLELGLTMGNLMACTRARIGRYGSQADCLESMRQLSLSEKGLDFAAQLEGKKVPYHTVLVPARYMEKPLYTIGLGDTFVAGMQMGFLHTK